ncbi:MAG TPA: FtsX-like permease family protein [Chloroflexota bacterium]
MTAVALYTRYAFRSFLRGRSRSIFGAFCVAVGIASVVALGLVGGNFQDAVTGNAQKLNRGDVSLQFNGQGIAPKDYAYFAQLKAQGAITDYTSLLRADAMIKRTSGDLNNVTIGSVIAVDHAKFPFYDTIKATKPDGVPLASLLASPNDAVVPQTVFDQLHLRIGGPVSVLFRFGGSRVFTVRGIVPDNAQDPTFGSGLFPYFAMVDRTAMATYMRNQNLAASQVYMKTSDAGQADVVKADLQRHFGPLVSPKTVADVQKDSVNGAEGFKKFFRMMGLVAVVIGGIGIINTMLVAARRRLKEIAILKAVGMKGRQVVLVFTIESLFLAIAGTAVGIALGLGASLIVNNITQSLAGYPIPWSLHTDALIAGLLVGIVATVLFAYIPVLRASRARPVAALRSDMETSIKRPKLRPFLRAMRTQPLVTIGTGIRRTPRGIIRLPKRQGLRTAVLVIVLAALMGYLGVLYTGITSGRQTVIVGVIAGIGTLVAAGLLTQVFVLIIWLVSKLPTFGRLPLRMAFRSMGTQKRRQGSTLLALCIGILSIGSIAILAQNIKHELAQGLEARQSYNVALQAPHNPATLARIDALVHKLDGDITHRYQGAIANSATLSQVDGRSVTQIVRQDLTIRKDGSRKYSTDTVTQAISNIRGIVGRDLSTTPDNYLIQQTNGKALGRNLNNTDTGTNHILVSNDFADVLGIHVGSRLVYADGARRVPFTVVGIASSNNFMTLSESVTDLSFMQRAGLTTPSGTHNAIVFLDIKSSALKADVAKLRATVPGGFVLDLDSFLEFTKVIDKLALFPEIIAGLSLFAGAVIIANTVALAMLERRRELGVMKAVGAKRRTILQFLFVENAVVGLLGAAAGVGLAMFATYMVNQNILQFPTTFDGTTEIALVVVGVILAVVASSLTALPASSEKPMSVLRYE